MILSFFLFLFLFCDAAQQIYPITNCAGYQFIEGTCTTTACHDPRCLTCSSTTVDCILCSTGYNLTRSQEIGSCILACSNSQVQTNHYNISSDSAFTNSADVCLDPNISKCTDSNCLSCLEDQPNTCLICEKGMFPRFYKLFESTKCVKCSLAMINCLECEWTNFCSACKSTSESSIGYIISDDGKTCKNCQEQVERCINCDGQQKCLECGSGSYLVDDGKHGSCDQCLSYCDVCTNDTICIQCIDSYFLFSESECQSCNDYIGNCNRCSKKDVCDQCESGYYLLDSQTCNNCSSIGDGLGLSCNGTHCTSCVANSTLDPNGKLCSPCSATANCNECDGLTCINCNEGYLLSNDKRTCISCQDLDGCANCDGKTCTICQNGYYRLFSEINQIYECFSCSTIDFSDVCDGLNCIKCLDNYLLTNNSMTCDTCDTFPYCAKCDGIYCALCQDGYYLKRNTSSWVPESCISCSDPNTGMQKCETCWNQNYCKKCENGYMLSPDSQCQICGNEPNCLTCDGYTCTSCFSGYYLTLQNTCSECLYANCLSCPYDTILKKARCILCPNGYYLHPISFTCISCKQNQRGQNCAICEYKSEIVQSVSVYQLNCLSCENNFGIVKQNSTCIACSMANCLSCNFDNSTKTNYCSKCSLGYYLETNGSCISCGLTNCLTCESLFDVTPRTFTCTVCSDGSFVNSTNQCQNCSEFIPGCTFCSLGTTNELICTACQASFYYLKNNSCSKCSDSIDSCKTCLENNQQILCVSCHDSYFLRSPLNCSNCLVPYCTYCSPRDFGKTCFDCLSGYYLEDFYTCSDCTIAINKCLACGINYRNILVCNKCEVGYYATLNDKNISICAACSQNCDVCLNNTYCTTCAKSFYKQINSNSAYCLSTSCESSSNIFNSINLTCTTCSIFYPNCSICDNNECSKCSSDNTFLMLPTKLFCSECNGSIYQKNQIDSAIYCAYIPSIKKLQRMYSITTGKTTINLDCGVKQKMLIYMTYYIYFETITESLNFTQVYDNLRNQTKGTTFFLRDENDEYWTVFLTSQTETTGKLDLVIPDLKNQGVNYKLQAWCYNFLNQSQTSDIISNVSSITWFQNDNGGSIVKVILGCSAILDNSSRIVISNILINLLNLKSMNRTLLNNLVDPNNTKNGVYETFYINRNFSSFIDLTSFTLISELKDPAFKVSLNQALQKENSSISIFDVLYDTINSTYWDADPIFKSIDFTRIFTADNTSAAFFLELSNINGFIYIGFVNKSETENLDWEHLSTGIDEESKNLNGFEKLYAKVGLTYDWKWEGLIPNQGYTIYFGATNEKKYENSRKTEVYRIVFKTKNNLNINK